MRISEYLKRIQNLPLRKRKIIFWLIIIIFGLILFTFWIISVQQAVKGSPKEGFLKGFKLPEFKEELKKLPELETEGKIKEFKESIGEIERLIEEAEEQKERN